MDVFLTTAGVRIRNRIFVQVQEYDKVGEPDFLAPPLDAAEDVSSAPG